MLGPKHSLRSRYGIAIDVVLTIATKESGMMSFTDLD
jgi:hypothetical protein